MDQKVVDTTDEKVLYEDKNLILKYVKDGNYVHETWYGYTPKDVFSELLYELIKQIKQTNSTGILLDAREHKGLGPDSQQLAATEIGNLAKEIGGIREAIVVPGDVFSKFSVENYTKKKDDSKAVETEFFDDLKKAEDWLKGK